MCRRRRVPVAALHGARAMAMRCFCPPLRRTPRSPTGVAYPGKGLEEPARRCAAASATSCATSFAMSCAASFTYRPRADLAPLTQKRAEDAAFLELTSSNCIVARWQFSFVGQAMVFFVLFRMRPVLRR